MYFAMVHGMGWREDKSGRVAILIWGREELWWKAKFVWTVVWDNFMQT